jgi:hypothetical protein
MAFLKKFIKAHKPINAIKNNPITAAIDEKKRGGDFMSVATAFIDPHETFGSNRTQTAEESTAARAKAKAKSKARRASRYAAGGKTRAYKKGGKTRSCCRGMGAATKGGGYGKLKII